MLINSKLETYLCATTNYSLFHFDNNRNLPQKRNLNCSKGSPSLFQPPFINFRESEIISHRISSLQRANK